MAAVSSPGNSSPPLSGLHLLLTYQCTFECDHCFVWSGPFQTGTMTLATVEHILTEAGRLGTIPAERIDRPRG
jgi:MoaA/NifB/PqqE/SkfB family radical SAM enzyme